MQSAHHAAHRARQTVLSEGGRIDSGRADHVRIEGTAEEAALVQMRIRAEQYSSGNSRNEIDLHGASSMANHKPPPHCLYFRDFCAQCPESSGATGASLPTDF